MVGMTSLKSLSASPIIYSGATDINMIFQEQKWEGPAGKSKSKSMSASEIASTKSSAPAKNKSNIMSAKDVLSMK